MKKFLLPLVLSTAALSAEEAPKVGIVNFASCLNDSKYGKHEQESFDSTRKQLVSLIEETEKQMKEVSDKLNDKDFVDGLSPEAEGELKGKLRSLGEEHGRYQQQFYAVMQQAQMKVLQSVNGYINQAAEKVASDKKLSMVVNKELCFFHTPSLEVTAEVIKEMDKKFEADPAFAKPADSNTKTP